MVQYIESCLALYDLKTDWQRSKEIRYNEYFFECSFTNGIKFKCRSDAYYVFDFSNANVGRSVEYLSNQDNLFVRNERIEVLHAFLVCLRHVTNRHNKCHHTFNMNFMDNYIVCSRDKDDLDQILAYNDPNYFSSNEYMQLCKEKLERIKERQTINLIDNTEILNEVCKVINKISEYNNARSLYILGVLYRAAVYYNLGLAMHSLIFMRSVYEWLVRKNSKNDKDLKPDDYNNCLISNGLKDKISIMNEFGELRNNAVHELNFPKDKILISEFFTTIQKIYNKEFGVEVNIPLGQNHFIIREEY